VLTMAVGHADGGSTLARRCSIVGVRAGRYLITTENASRRQHCQECGRHDLHCINRPPGPRMHALRVRVPGDCGGNPPQWACCGEQRLPFLAMDHINGGGKAHLLIIGGARNGPHVLYRWLKKNGYPAGFRVLCHNCNVAIGHYGRCSHEDERMHGDAG
jgi:hypothetical protein